MLNKRVDWEMDRQTDRWEGGQARGAWKTVREEWHLCWGIIIHKIKEIAGDKMFMRPGWRPFCSIRRDTGWFRARE